MAEPASQQQDDDLHDVSDDQDQDTLAADNADDGVAVKVGWSSGTRRRSDPNVSHKVIEKRRRDRINKCLGELSKLIPAAYVKQQGTGKLEKAEILEMTVEHMKSLHQAGVTKRETATLPREATPDMLVKYRAGFGECVSEVARFLSTAEGLDPNNPRFIRLLNHLQLHGNRENPLPGAVAVESGSDANHKNGELPSLPSPGRGTADLKGSQPSPLGLVPPHAGVLPPVSLAAMAMLQQTVLQHQLAAAASLHQADQSAATLQHAQAQAAAAAAALQLPAYHAAYQASSPAIIPLALQTALNPRLAAISNQAFLAALVSNPGVLANFGHLGPTSYMLPLTSSGLSGISTSVREAASDTLSATATEGDDGLGAKSSSKGKGTSSRKKSQRSGGSHGTKSSKSKQQKGAAKSLHLPTTVEGEEDEQEGSNAEREEEDGSDQISHQNGDSPSTPSSPVVSHDNGEDDFQDDGQPSPKKAKVSCESAHPEVTDNSIV